MRNSFSQWSLSMPQRLNPGFFDLDPSALAIELSPYPLVGLIRWCFFNHEYQYKDATVLYDHPVSARSSQC